MTDAPESTAAVAERAAREGGAVANERFRGKGAVETKSGKTDYVTEADRLAQRRVVDVVSAAYPEDAIVGEEEDVAKSVPETGRAWVIDPIDGTHNFVRHLPLWTTSVAAVADGEPLAACNYLPPFDAAYVAGDGETTRNGTSVSVSDTADPEACTVAPTFYWGRDARDEYAAAARAIVERFGDMRRLGSIQVSLALLAEGALDGVVTNLTPNPWDSIAGVHLVRRAGGTVTDVHGEPWRLDSEGLVASNGRVHDEVLDAAREIGDG
ncbi:inositol monophosphatase [Halovivax sp.]|uniref:inositol monophosphatase family protein n=1 Tax=Halovivax sp. TaxID=1935978 RepID=UPI0025BB63C3|nr:inositol monophosphatase [Halovivax sp.]